MWYRSCARLSFIFAAQASSTPFGGILFFRNDRQRCYNFKEWRTLSWLQTLPPKRVGCSRRLRRRRLHSPDAHHGAWTRALPATRSLDVITAFEAGQANQSISDDDRLVFATGLGRAILTRNRKDFIYLHKYFTPHAGIISITDDSDFVGQAGRIDQAMAGLSTLANQHVRVNRPSPPATPSQTTGRRPAAERSLCSRATKEASLMNGSPSSPRA